MDPPRRGIDGSRTNCAGRSHTSYQRPRPSSCVCSSPRRAELANGGACSISSAEAWRPEGFQRCGEAHQRSTRASSDEGEPGDPVHGAQCLEAAGRAEAAQAYERCSHCPAKRVRPKTGRLVMATSRRALRDEARHDERYGRCTRRTEAPDSLKIAFGPAGLGQIAQASRPSTPRGDVCQEDPSAPPDSVAP